jgi:DNA modification methylase
MLTVTASDPVFARVTERQAQSSRPSAAIACDENIIGKIFGAASDNCALMDGSTMIGGDCRAILRAFADGSVHCTVTSPPYGDLKDYGTADQIGYGQDYASEYLPSLRAVLSELHRISSPGAALWLVLDTVRRNGAVAALPWQVAELAKSVGWTFHDLVIWDKGRTLPWSHRGRFRNVFEYVLLLGRGPLAVFDLDAIRETDSLGPYWVRYPERYHPQGKAPNDLWHFPIPLQGSWTQSAIKHACPFPVGLVARMIALTSRPGSVVLDCFAGTGSVPATAAAMGRQGIGIEVNPDFVKAYADGVCKELTHRAGLELSLAADGQNLRETIIHLRMHKYAKSLFTEISRGHRMNGSARKGIRGTVLRATEVIDDNGTPGRSYTVGKIELDVLAERGVSVSRLRDHIADCVAKPPLSKFGIQPIITVRPATVWSNASYIVGLGRGPWYVYTSGRFHMLHSRVERKALHAALLAHSVDTRTKYPALFSKLKLEIPLPSGG